MWDHCSSNVERKPCDFISTRKAGGVNLTFLPIGFSKAVFSRERLKPRFLVTFNMIIRDIFTANITEIHQIIQKI